MSSIDAVLRTAIPQTSTGTQAGSGTSSGLTSLALSANSAVNNTSPSADDSNSWFAAMAKAWGQALDQQAQSITQLSDQVSNGGQDQPSQITQLTAASLRFSFLSSNASTATTSIGEALQTLGRKQ
ncbi:MAG: hypothetical protein OSA97_20725 [Nevskia sp.]|nr:hypothetical protein [Nevskia sp.]